MHVSHAYSGNVCALLLLFVDSSKAWNLSTNTHDWFFTFFFSFFFVFSHSLREKLFSASSIYTSVCILHMNHKFAFTRKWHVHNYQDDRNLMSFHSLLFRMWTKISGDKCTRLLKKISASLNLNFTGVIIHGGR